MRSGLSAAATWAGRGRNWVLIVIPVVQTVVSVAGFFLSDKHALYTANIFVVALLLAAIIAIDSREGEQIIEAQVQSERSIARLETTIASGLGTVRDTLVGLGSPTPEIVASHLRPTDVDWERLFKSATHVEIIAVFCEHISDHAEAVRGFFERKGRMVVVTVDPRERQAKGFVDRRRFNSIDHAGIIPPKTMAATIFECLRLMRGVNADPEQLRVVVFPAPLNFHAYCFDRRTLVHGAYEHLFCWEARAPRVEIDLRSSTAWERFWTSEMDSLLRYETLSGEAYLELQKAHTGDEPDLAPI